MIRSKRSTPSAHQRSPAEESTPNSSPPAQRPPAQPHPSPPAAPGDGTTIPRSHRARQRAAPATAIVPRSTAPAPAPATASQRPTAAAPLGEPRQAEVGAHLQAARIGQVSRNRTTLRPQRHQSRSPRCDLTPQNLISGESRPHIRVFPEDPRPNRDPAHTARAPKSWRLPICPPSPYVLRSRGVARSSTPPPPPASWSPGEGPKSEMSIAPGAVGEPSVVDRGHGEGWRTVADEVQQVRPRGVKREREGVGDGEHRADRP